MVPVHESDLGQDGWTQVDWENYELWEKIEVRLRRKKQLWILVTVILFLALSSIPIVIDRWPKWTTRSIARRLAQELNWVKKEADIHRSAYRFRFSREGNFDFTVEKLAGCDATSGEEVKKGSLVHQKTAEKYSWLTYAKGADLGIPGVISEFCYDPFGGSDLIKRGENLAGFAVIPVRDLTEKRLDRITVLLLSGVSAEISFD